MEAVPAEWFFSTIAQASAASIGFLIAFIAAQYSSRKNKHQDNYNRLLDRLEEIEEDYNPILGKMEDQLTGVTNFPSHGGGIDSAFQIDATQDEIKQVANGFSQSEAVKVYANLKRSQKLLNSLILPQPNNKKKEYLRLLNNTSKYLSETLTKNGSAQSFLSDTSIGTLTANEVRNKDAFPDVASQTYPGKTEIQTKTMKSWKDILNKYRQETVRASMMAQDSELVTNHKEYAILLNQILRFFFVGVIFPMLFLLAWSPDGFVLPNVVVAGIEIAIVFVISYQVQKLFRTVKSLINLSSNL